MARNMTPDQLDPLVAASSPISVEPSVGGADQAAIDLLMSQGMSYAQAARRVSAEKAKASAGFQSRIDDARAIRSQNPLAQAMQSMPMEEEVTPDDLRGAGLLSQAEPGPRGLGNIGKVTPGRQFSRMSDSRAYTERVPVTDENRKDAAPDAAYMPSERDSDMAARGFFPVNTPDGGVAYSVGTGAEAMYAQDEGRDIPGAPGRLGPRRDLQETDPSKPGFTLERVQGPTGYNYIYKQNEAARTQQANYMKERQLYRMAKSANMSPAEFAAQNPEMFGDIASDPAAKARIMVQGARQADEAERNAALRAQVMLAGANPARNAVNAYRQLNDPNTNEWQRLVLTGMLINGANGATPLSVEAAHNAALTKLGLSVAEGRGYQNHLANGTLNPIQQQQLNAAQDRQQQDAVEWADRHVSSNYAEPQGFANFLNRLAIAAGMPLHDNTEFTAEEQEKAVQALLVQYPSMQEAEARRIIDSVGATRTARKKAAPAASAAPPAPAAPTPPARGDL